jgi:putative endonuclease
MSTLARRERFPLRRPHPFTTRLAEMGRICSLVLIGREWIAVGRLERMRLACVERAVAGLERIAERRGKASDPAHLLTGTEGEDAAYFYLRRKGYIVVARRWSCGERPGDLDLIAWQGPMLCFVEVKTRTLRDMTPAEAAVDRHKRSILRRLAMQYLRQLPQAERPPVRFDVISVYLVPGQAKELVHFENAFGWDAQREHE